MLTIRYEKNDIPENHDFDVIVNISQSVVGTDIGEDRIVTDLGSPESLSALEKHFISLRNLMAERDMRNVAVIIEGGGNDAASQMMANKMRGDCGSPDIHVTVFAPGLFPRKAHRPA